MKRFLALCFALLMLLCFAGCGGVNREAELQLCGAYGVPGMFCEEIKGTDASCNVIEEDAEGRILFQYETDSIITRKKESALVICQFRDSKYVYYYEDICYCFNDNDPQTIESLKKANDWGQPLDYSKMSRRKIKVSFDLFIVDDTELKHNKLKEVSSKAINIKLNHIRELCFVDCDSMGHELYYLVSNATKCTYFLLFDSQYNVSVLEIVDRNFDPEAFAHFKRDNGWVYGFRTD